MVVALEPIGEEFCLAWVVESYSVQPFFSDWSCDDGVDFARVGKSDAFF